MISNKQIYRDFCKTEPTIPIFSKDWWLDAVCGKDNWDVAVVEKGGQIIASMPYYIVKRRGMRTIAMPKLTQTMGQWGHGCGLQMLNMPINLPNKRT